MATQMIKKAVERTFRARPITIMQELSKKSPIPIRHFKFNFKAEELDVKFYLQKEWASAFFAALSIFLTYGEELVIETARYHRDFLSDPILKQRVTALIGQEALHSKLHNEYNDIMIPNNIPVQFFRYLAEQVFKHSLLKFPQPLKLSLMAGIEHFTAVLAQYMMEHEDHFFHSDDEKARALWMWHMLEESEHKDIAYDVYQVLSNNYPLRILGFVIAAFTLFVGVSTGALMLPFFRHPQNFINLQFWKEAKESWSLLFGPKRGIFGSTTPHIFDYLRRDFHPNDHDTSEYLEYYKERLLNPDTGLLTPYFVKEFFPPIRAN